MMIRSSKTSLKRLPCCAHPFSTQSSAAASPSPSTSNSHRSSYSTPQDAYDHNAAPTSFSLTHAVLPYVSNPNPTMNRRKAPMRLGEAERDMFLKLISQISTNTNKSSEISEFEKANLDHQRRIQSRSLRRTKSWNGPLKEAEEAKLDKMKLVIGKFESEWELMLWAQSTIFSNPRFIKSPLYSHVLLELFLTLRDDHSAPHTALDIFHIASREPVSFVSGCSTKLFNEVLRTRWMLLDVEGIQETVEFMVNRGVHIDNGTCDLVSDIGVAMRRDQDTEDYWLAAKTSTSTPTPSITHRYFSDSQIGAWTKLDAQIEQYTAREERKKIEETERDYKDSEQKYMFRMNTEREEAERLRPSLAFGGRGFRNFSTKSLSNARLFSTSAGRREAGDVAVGGGKVPIGKIDRRLQITFTCTALVHPPSTPDIPSSTTPTPSSQTEVPCGHRSTHEFSKRSYDKGIVLVECPACKSRHLIADNLGWFSQTPSPGNPDGLAFSNKERRTVEDLMREKGQKVVIKESEGPEGGTWEIEG